MPNHSLSPLYTTLPLLLLLLGGCAAASSSNRGAEPVRAETVEETEATPPPAEAPLDVEDASGSADDGPKSEEAPRNKTSVARDPQPAPEPSMDAPASVATESGGGWFEGDTFEGDTYDQPSARAEVDQLADKIRGFKKAQQQGITDRRSGGTSGCSDVCDLSEAICSSSRKICKIATANPSESYFGQRCGWSKRECGTADDRCVRCK